MVTTSNTRALIQSMFIITTHILLSTKSLATTVVLIMILLGRAPLESIRCMCVCEVSTVEPLPWKSRFEAQQLWDFYVHLDHF